MSNKITHSTSKCCITSFLNSIIKPIICYGCEIWGFIVTEEIERIEVKYLKYILHLPKNATNSAVREELGQFPLHLFWKENIIKYMRICSFVV